MWRFDHRGSCPTKRVGDVIDGWLHYATSVSTPAFYWTFLRFCGQGEARHETALLSKTAIRKAILTKNSILAVATSLVALACPATIAMADAGGHAVSDEVLAEQRAVLATATDGMGYGPQSPRDIDSHGGANHRAFSTAPAATEMTLCDIHFHENAEHSGGEFTTYAGNGDGHGYGTGFMYDGALSDAELAPVGHMIGQSDHGDLEPGDTIEVHFVYSTAQATLGPSLGTCLSDAIGNPQLRVEAVVAVLVNDGG